MGGVLLQYSTRCAAAVACLLALPCSSGAFDQDDRDVMGRHLGATAEAVSKFGEAGETLRHIASGQFAGSGSQRREMARRVDAALDPWRKASSSVRNSLPYKIVPHALLFSDVATTVIAPTLEGDYRGAVAAAVNIGASPTVTGAGASFFGAIGTGFGSTVGSFVPVVGTAVGGMVGGAVGAVAGGYISAAGYDLYVRELVQDGVEVGIASVFDISPLQQAMQARHDFLRERAADDLKQEWEKLHVVSRDFAPEQIELVGPGSTPYVVSAKPPVEADDSGEEPVSEASDFLLGVRKFAIGPLVWEIEGGYATTRAEYPGVTHSSHTAKGQVIGNRIVGTMHWLLTSKKEPCSFVVRETSPFVLEFSADTVKGELQSGPVEVLSTTCEGEWAKTTQPLTFTSDWRVLE